MSFSTGTKIGSNMGTWLNTNSTSSSSSNGASGSSGSSGSTSSGSSDFDNQLAKLKQAAEEQMARQVQLRTLTTQLNSSMAAAKQQVTG
jgi:hypothetical protein